MSISRKAIFGFIALITLSYDASALTSSWNVSTDGNWDVSGNWTHGVPNGIDDIAIFPDTLSGDITATLGPSTSYSVTLGSIEFQKNLGGGLTYAIGPYTNPPANTNTIIFDTTGSYAQLTADIQESTIRPNIILNKDLRVNSVGIVTIHISSNVVSGEGGIIKVGDGDLYMNCVFPSTYSGNTTLSEGLIVLGDDFVNDSSTLVIDGGTYDFNGLTAQFKSLEFNSGSVEPSSSSKFYLSGDGNVLSMKGSTSINNAIDLLSTEDDVTVLFNDTTGTATIGPADTFNLGDKRRIFNIQNGSNAVDMEISSEITDNITPNSPGGIDKRGSGTLLLSNNNSYTGDTVIREGTLKLGSVNAIPSNTSLLIEDGTFDMDNNSISIDSLLFYSGTVIQGTGILILEAASGPALIMRDTILPGNLILDDASGSVSFDATNDGTAQILGNIDLNALVHTFDIEKGLDTVDMKISGVLSDGGVTKEGLGTLELLGANTFTKATTINAGRLAVNGSLHNTQVLVSTLGILQGTGTIGATSTTVTNNGEVTPGNSIGTLTINGNYIQNAQGSLAIEIESASSFDRLVVNTGSVSLEGAVFFDYLGEFSLDLSDQITFIDNSSGTGVSGSFTEIIENNLHPAFKSVLTYNPNTVVLSFIEQTVPLISFPSFSTNIFSLMESPVIFLSRHLETLRQTLHNRYSHRAKELRDYSMVFPMNVDAEQLMAKQGDVFQPVQKNGKTKSYSPYSIYMGPIGSIGNTESVRQQKGVDSNSIGALLGFDAIYDYSSFGIIASYERLKAKVDDNWGKFTVDAAGLNGYGTWSPKCLSHYFIDGVAGIGYQWQHIHREAYNATASSSPESFSGNAVLGTGYNFCTSRVSFVPKVSLQYMGYYQEDFKEKGAGLQGLSYKDQTGQSLRPTFTLSFLRSSYSVCKFSLLPEVHLRYQRELLDRNSSLHYTGGTIIDTNNLTLIGGARDYFYAGGSLQLKKEDFSFDVSYDFEWNAHFQTHRFYAGMNFPF